MFETDLFISNCANSKVIYAVEAVFWFPLYVDYLIKLLYDWLFMKIL